MKTRFLLLSFFTLKKLFILCLNKILGLSASVFFLLVVFAISIFFSHSNFSYGQAFPVQFERNNSQQEIYKAKLVTPFTQLKKGEKNQVGLWIHIQPDWYTYWFYAGDYGKTLKAKWKLPKGISITEPSYPLPQRQTYKIGNQASASFVYKKEVLILFDLLIDKDYPHKQASISLDLELFVCKDICISKHSNPSIEIEITTAPLTERPFYFDLFKKWQKKQAKKIKLKSDFKQQDDNFLINFYFDNYVKCLDVFPISRQDFSTQKAVLLNQTEKSCSFKLKKNESSLPVLSGLLVYEQGSKTSSSFFKSHKKQTLGILWFILMAFLGGLILNIMPCVLPIIFLKFYNTLELAHVSKAQAMLLNLSYVFGVISSFLILAVLILLFKQSGESVGWGFHLQSPLFVISLCLLFFFMAFYLLNLFTIPTPTASLNFKNKKVFPHFLTGVMSTTAASPCTVPFMASAVGFAFSRSFVEVFIIFFFLGFGLSFPYVVLSFFPHWLKYIPTPKKWMNKIKSLLSIPLFLTILWFLFIVYQQLEFYIFILSLCVFPAAGLLIVIQNFTPKYLYRIKKIASVFVFVLIFAILLSTWYLNKVFNENDLAYKQSTTQRSSIYSKGGLSWYIFSKKQIEESRKKGDKILVVIGAEWCLTCKLNERVFYDRKIIQFLKENKISLYYGDWTNRDPLITKFLESYGQKGIPFYLIYNREMEAKILPTLLFKKRFLKDLNQFFLKETN